MLVLTLAGCFGDFSNAPLVEDALFVEAFPPAALFAPAGWDEAPEPPDDAPAFYTFTLEQLSGIAGFGSDILDITQLASVVGPTERGQDYRVWGPGSFDEHPGNYLRIEVSRTSDGGLYTFDVGASDSPEGPWVSFLYGSRWTDDVDRAWSGDFEWNASQLGQAVGVPGEGRISADYLDGDDGVHGMAFTLTEPRDGASSGWFGGDESGAGTLQWGLSQDIIPTSELQESLQLSVAWNEDGAGRGDAVITGGDAGGVELTLTQCWDAAGSMVYAQTLEEHGEHQGDADDCIFSEALEADRI